MTQETAYQEALDRFGLLAGLSREDAEVFSRLSQLRNLLAHEYLNLLFEKLREFIEVYPGMFRRISAFLDQYLTG